MHFIVVHLCDNLRVALDSETISAVVEVDDTVRGSENKLSNAYIVRKGHTSLYVLESFEEVLELVGKVIHV